MADLLRGPVTVANLTAAAGVTTTVDGWWPCLDITWRTPVPASITRIVAQVRERGSSGLVAESVVTPGDGLAKIVNGVSMGQHLEVRLSPAGAPGLPFQPTPWLEVTTSWDALIAALDGLSIGCFTEVCGVGVPTRTDLPVGSRYTREDVSQLWRYVGNATAETLTLTNPGFEAGSTTGWTATTGSISATTDFVSVVFPRTGSYMLSCVGGGPSVIFHQDLAVPSGAESAVDAGLAVLSGVEAYHNSRSTVSAPNDQGRLFVAFLDGLGAVLDTVYTSWDDTLASVWTQMSIPGTAVPAGTRTVRIGAENTPDDATHDNFWDDFASPTLNVGGWVLMSDLSSIKNEGVEIEGSPRSMDFVGAGLDATSDGFGAVTVTLNSDTDATLAANSNDKLPTQAAVKGYVDAKVAGLSWKQAVRAGTTANITLSGAQTIDGVSVVAGDRVLVKNQTTGSQNGLYVAASGSWTRATDADSGAELVNATAYVSEGTTNADTQWTCTTNATITVGSTSLAFAQLSSGGGGSLAVKDEGSTLSSAVTSIDFTGSGVTATNVGGAVTVNIPLASSGSVVAAAGLVAPQGRLTLVTGVAVMTSDQTAKTHVYYTSYIGASVPVFDGTNWTQWVLGSDLDMALDTSNQTSGNLYDLFSWVNSGVLSIGAGPAWSNTATITVTIATPAVVSWTAHGLSEGAPVVFTTTGALPTGITAGTTYYVGRSPGTNSFNISTSVANAAAGTFVATSGSQSGTHTATNGTTVRGTGAGTSELQMLNGIWTNKNSITLKNGAGAGTSGIAANKATYLGTIYTTAAGQTGMAFKPAAANGGTANILGLYNAYNRLPVTALSRDTNGGTDYTYNSTTWRPANNNTNDRISWVDGLQQSTVNVENTAAVYNNSSTGQGFIGTNLDSTTNAPGVGTGGASTNASTIAVVVVTAAEQFLPQLGFHYAQRMEATTGASVGFGTAVASAPARQLNAFRLSLEM